MSSFFLKLFSSLGWLFVLTLIGLHTLPSQGLETYCGRKLGDTLDLICKNGFGSKLKKSMDSFDYNYLDSENLTPFAFEEFPFLSQFQRNSVAKTRRRRYPGVANECCKKPCSIQELLMFCKPLGIQ